MNARLETAQAKLGRLEGWRDDLLKEIKFLATMLAKAVREVEEAQEAAEDETN